MHDLSVLRQGPVAEIRHDLTSPHGRNAEYFRRRGQAGATFRNAVIEHRRHSGAHRRLVDFQSIGLFPDQFAYLVGEYKDLEHAQPTAIAGAAAAFTPGRRLKRLAALEAERAEPRVFGEIGLGDCFWHFAAVAQLPNESLRDHGSQGGAQQIPLDAKIEKTGHRGGGRFGVQGGQNKVTG
jgi:hypothetical protein